MSISELFIKRPAMTTALTVSTALFGVMAYMRLPVNDLPAVDYPVIQVQVAYPGASPTTMANNVATPLERQFMQIPGLELVTSQSTQGQCTLILQFALNKSIDAAATDVQSQITQATGNLPVDLPAPPTFTKTNPNDQPIIYVGLTTDSLTAGQLYDYASTQIAQQITIVDGVSRVLIYGSKTAVRIKADPTALALRGLTIDDLGKAVSSGTAYQGAGQFDGSSRTFLLQPRGQLETAADYGELIVGMHDGAPVRVKDVAKPEDSLQDERIALHFWARGVDIPSATVVLAVFRQAGANAVEVASKVKGLVPTLMASLPASIRIAPIYDRSISIQNSVKDVEETLVIAFVLVVGVIFVFLGRASDTLIPTLALPLSLLLTFMAMMLLGYSLDNLSLMALTLAIGFLVDDAIVFLENAVRRMEQFGESPLQASLAGASEISFTIVSMTISLAAVFLPLVFMPGLVGRIFREFAVTIVVAIFASGIVSLTLTPLMCARMLGARGGDHRASLMERVANAVIQPVIRLYGRTLWFFLRWKSISALAWVGCLAGTIWLLMIVPKAFLPVGDSSFILGVFIAPEGTSPKEMYGYQKKVDEAIRNNPAVQTSFSAAGVSGFLPSNMGFAGAFLSKPGTRPPIGAVAGQLMGAIMSSGDGVLAFLQPNPVLEISTGATNKNQGDYAFAISGINPAEVYSSAEQLLGRFYGSPLFATVSSDFFNKTPNLEIDILRDQASSYGVSVNTIESQIRRAYSQSYLYLIKKPEDQYQLILEVNDHGRSRPEDLNLLYVRSDDGKNLVPLKAVAKWRETTGPQSVNHLNQFTSVTIFFNLAPGVAIGDATAFVEKTAAEILPPTVRSGLQGQALAFRDTITQLVFLMLLAVFVMYVILVILYESYIHPITVLSSLPVALVGGLATLHLFHEQASLYAFVGLFMLMGIVKKNGIMMVDFALQRMAEGRSSVEAIHDASVDRFRPIIMTTLAALMGAIPIALGFGADGESRRPLGLVIVGGLVVSQVITLYVTPALYLYLEWFQVNVLDRSSFFRDTRHMKH